jgi:AraC-like DNA-binding protein
VSIYCTFYSYKPKIRGQLPIRNVNDVELFPAVFTRREHQKELLSIEQIRFQLLYLRYAEVGPEWNTGDTPRCDGFHHLHFVCDGKAEIRWPKGRMDMLPGNVYWLVDHTPVHACCPEKYHHYFMTFRCEWLPGLDLFWDWNTPMCLGKWDAEKWIALWKQQPLPLREYWRVQSLVQQLFAESFPNLADTIARQSTRYTKFKAVFDLMDKKANAQIQIGELAASQGLTPNSFSRLFREYFHTSPKDYFNRRLNAAACQMLLTSDIAVGEVAKQLKFSDAYYFNRFFKKMNGTSPARYRKQFRSQHKATP